MRKHKYVCFIQHEHFVFYSAYRLNSRGNRADARMAYSKLKGTLFPAEDFTNIVNWKDYPIDEPAING